MYYLLFCKLVFQLHHTITLIGLHVKRVKKNSNKTQALDIFLFTLLVMLGNYENTCNATIKMETM